MTAWQGLPQYPPPVPGQFAPGELPPGTGYPNPPPDSGPWQQGPPAPNAPGERKRKYTDAQRQAINQGRQRRGAGLQWGYSLESQGKRPEVEYGVSGLRSLDLKRKFGQFANPTWDYQVVGGVLMRRPKANQTGRISEQGGTAKWEAAPDYAQNAYRNANSYFSANPSNTWEQFAMQRAVKKHMGGWRARGENFTVENGIVTGPNGEQWTTGGQKIENGSPVPLSSFYGPGGTLEGGRMGGYLNQGGGGGVRGGPAGYAQRPDIGGYGQSGPFFPGDTGGGPGRQPNQPNYTGTPWGGLYSYGYDYNQYGSPYATGGGPQQVQAGQQFGSARGGLPTGSPGGGPQQGGGGWSNPAQAIGRGKGWSAQ